MRARTIILTLFCVSLMVATSIVCIVDSRDGDYDDGSDVNGKTVFYENHIKYIVNPGGNTVRVDGQNFGTDADISVPSKVTHKGKEYTVTELANHAFSWSRGHNPVRSIEIGPEIEIIRHDCFASGEFHATEHFTIRDVEHSKLRQIGEYAFKDSAIKSIVLPASLERIDHGAFNDCKSLKDVKILGSHGFTISDDAFKGCRVLENINLENATKIGSESFLLCYNLKELNLSSIKGIYKHSFSDSKKISHVIFGNDFNHVSGCSFEVKFYDANGNQIKVGDPTLDKLRGKEFKLIDGRLTEVVHLPNASAI